MNVSCCEEKAFTPKKSESCNRPGLRLQCDALQGRVLFSAGWTLFVFVLLCVTLAEECWREFLLEWGQFAFREGHRTYSSCHTTLLLAVLRCTCSPKARELVAVKTKPKKHRKRRGRLEVHTPLLTPQPQKVAVYSCIYWNLLGRTVSPSHLDFKLEMLGSIVSRLAHYDACVNLSTLCKSGIFWQGTW